MTTPPDNSEWIDELRGEMYEVWGLNVKDSDEFEACFERAKAQIIAKLREARIAARIDARTKLLNKLVRTYSPINKPIKDSPLELTFEAEQYNRFVQDLWKFVDIELKKHERSNSPQGEEAGTV